MIKPKMRDNRSVYKIGVFVDCEEDGKAFRDSDIDIISDSIVKGIYSGLNPFEDSDIVEIVTPNDEFIKNEIGVSQELKVTGVDSLEDLLNDASIRVMYVFSPDNRAYGEAVARCCIDNGTYVVYHVFDKNRPEKIDSKVTEATKPAAKTKKRAEGKDYDIKHVTVDSEFSGRGKAVRNNLIPRKIGTKDGFYRTYYVKPFVDTIVQHVKKGTKTGENFLKSIKSHEGVKDKESVFGTMGRYLTSLFKAVDPSGHGQVPTMFQKLGMSTPANESPTGLFSTRINPAGEGKLEFVHSVLSRAMGYLKSKGTGKDVGMVYKHTEEGMEFEETAWLYHKRHKAGGADNKTIAAYGDEVMRMADMTDAGFPDTIVTPSLTWTEKDKDKYGDMSNKMNSSIQHRVSKLLSDKLRLAVDNKTNEVLTMKDVVERKAAGDNQSFTEKQIEYDPMALGLKSAEAKKMTKRIRDENGDLQWQQSAKVRNDHVYEVLKAAVGLTGKPIVKDGYIEFDEKGQMKKEYIDPEVVKQNEKAFRNKFRGKNVWILDDNVDKGSTIHAMDRLLREYGGARSTHAFTMMNMAAPKIHEYEGQDALHRAERDGRALYELRRQL